MTVKILQRMPEDLHKRLKAHAILGSTSVNVLINEACEHYLASGDIPTLAQRMSALESQVAEMRKPQLFAFDGNWSYQKILPDGTITKMIPLSKLTLAEEAEHRILPESQQIIAEYRAKHGV